MTAMPARPAARARKRPAPAMRARTTGNLALAINLAAEDYWSEL